MSTWSQHTAGEWPPSAPTGPTAFQVDAFDFRAFQIDVTREWASSDAGTWPTGASSEWPQHTAGEWTE